MSSTEWKFNGPNGAVSVSFPEGRTITVAPGDVVELVPSEAKAVAALPGWAPVKKKTKAEPAGKVEGS